MSGLTVEQRQKLDELITEYGMSLQRTYDERQNRKEMEAMAQTLLIKPQHFKKLATAIWDDKRELVQSDLDAQLDLFALFEDRPA
jgi:hypothetical protein